MRRIIHRVLVLKVLQRSGGAFVLASALCVATLAGGLTGCQKALFDAKDPRSQFDRTDATRNARPEQWVMDEYGRRRPNIRGRLIGNQ